MERLLRQIIRIGIRTEAPPRPDASLRQLAGRLNDEVRAQRREPRGEVVVAAGREGDDDRHRLVAVEVARQLREGGAREKREDYADKTREIHRNPTTLVLIL